MKRFIKYSLFITVTLGVLFLGQPAHADSFNPGRIIDDSVFTNSSTMNTTTIQTFLNSKVPTCDTNGTQSAADWGYPNLTHAQFATQVKGWPGPPYPCLKDYTEGGLTAAQIIYNVAQTYSINPEVLLTTLQKESSLITDTWPMPWQYRTATGYGCPDTAPCDSQYYGLTNQITWAAKLYHSVVTNSSTWYSPYVTGNNYILWNPNKDCGGSTVNIQNWATASLYDYTPYQPNQASLNAGWGTGDGCSSYGNRNFWLYFTNWFGSTTSNLPNIYTSSSLDINGGQPVREGQVVHAKFTLRNGSAIDLQTGTIGVSGRDASGTVNRDIAYTNVMIPANSSSVIDFTFTVPQGVTNYWISSAMPGIGWNNSYPLPDKDIVKSLTITGLPNPTVVSGLSLSTSTPRVDVPNTVSYSVKNYTQNPVSFGTTGVAMRSPSNKNADIAWENPIIPSAGLYTYSKTFTFSEPGKYSAWIGNARNDIGWNNIYPVVDTSGLTKSATWDVLPNPSVTTSLVAAPANPHVGEPVTFTYTIKNFSSKTVDLGSTGVAMRSPDNKVNEDISWEPLLLSPGATFSYNKTTTFTVPGNHTAWVGNYQPSVGWNASYPQVDPGVSRNLTIPVSPNPTIVSSLTLDTTTPKVGQLVTATFAIKNYSSQPVSIGTIGLAMRSPTNTNADVAYDQVTIAAGATYSFSRSFKFNQSGTYQAWIANCRDNIGWSASYPASENTSIIRTTSWTVSP